MPYNVPLLPLCPGHTGKLSKPLSLLTQCSCLERSSPPSTFSTEYIQKLTVTLFTWKSKIRRPLEGNICLEAVLLRGLFAFKAIPRSALHFRRAILVSARFGACWFLAGFTQKKVVVTCYTVKERLRHYVLLSHLLQSSSSHWTCLPWLHFYQLALSPGVWYLPAPPVPLVYLGQQLLPVSVQLWVASLPPGCLHSLFCLLCHQLLALNSCPCIQSEWCLFSWLNTDVLDSSLPQPIAKVFGGCLPPGLWLNICVPRAPERTGMGWGWGSFYELHHSMSP